MSSLFEEMMQEISEKDIKIADLETKLAESENKIYELQTRLNLKEYEPVFCRLAGRDCEELGKVDQLKQQVNDWKQRFESSEERNKQMTDNGVKSLELKNEKINQLTQALAETDKLMQEYLSKCLSLEQQLAEKDAEVQNWKDGTMVVKLGKLEEQLAEKEKFLERIMSGEYIPANIAEKSLKLSNQTAIAELEKVKEKLNKYNKEHCFLSTEIDTCEKAVEFIDQQIKLLKGEK